MSPTSSRSNSNFCFMGQSHLLRSWGWAWNPWWGIWFRLISFLLITFIKRGHMWPLAKELNPNPAPSCVIRTVTSPCYSFICDLGRIKLVNAGNRQLWPPWKGQWCSSMSEPSLSPSLIFPGGFYVSASSLRVNAELKKAKSQNGRNTEGCDRSEGWK